MKKALSLILAVVMMLSCFVGMTFTTSAQDALDYTKNLHKGDIGSGQYNWAKDAVIAQRFTLLKGAILTNYTIGKLYTGGDGSVNTGKLEIFQWNTDYATTVAANALYTMDIVNHTDSYPLIANVPTDLAIEGEVLVVLSYLSGTGMWMPLNASNGAAEGVTNYRNGEAFVGEAGAQTGRGIYSWIGYTAKEPGVYFPKTTNLYPGTATLANIYHWTNGADFGQKFYVPAGNALTGITILKMAATSATNAGTFKVYQWDTDYATSVAGGALFTYDIVNHPNNSQFDVAIPEELGLSGDLLYVVDCTSDSSSWGYSPFGAGAKSMMTDVIYFCNGQPFSGADNNNRNAYGIAAMMTTVQTSDIAESKVYLCKGDTNGDNVTYEGSAFGQRFTVAEGKALTGINIGSIGTYGDDGVNSGTFKVYQWNTDYATTVAGTALYTADIANLKDNAAFGMDIPASEGITGDIYYEIALTGLDNGKFAPYNASGGNADGVECYFDGVAKTGLGTGGIYASAYVIDVAEEVEEKYVYVNSLDGEVLYTGNVALGEVTDAMLAKLNNYVYANDTYNAFVKFEELSCVDGVHTYYSVHNTEATVTVNGEAVAPVEGGSYYMLKAEEPAEGEYFFGWRDSDTYSYISRNAEYKFFPDKNVVNIEAVYVEYESTNGSSATATATREVDKLIVKVLPNYGEDKEIVNFGYYVAVSDEATMSNDEIIANGKKLESHAPHAYMVRTHTITEASQSKYIHIVAYYTYVDGNGEIAEQKYSPKIIAPVEEVNEAPDYGTGVV